MKYLVDANVLSEPTKPAPEERVVAWLRRNQHLIAIDPVILGEVRFGILLLPRGARRTRLDQWFTAGVRRLHCIPWDAACVMRWAALLAQLRLEGKAMPINDSLIATTALVHKLTVVTRNASHFAPAGAPVVDPFA